MPAFIERDEEGGFPIRLTWMLKKVKNVSKDSRRQQKNNYVIIMKKYNTCYY